MFHYLPKAPAVSGFPSSILILFFFLVARATSGQIDFRPGYIVKSNSDTLRGYVVYRGDKKNYKDCVFREKLKGEVISYSPEDIMAYGIDGEKSFRSMELPKDAPKQGKSFVRVLSEGYADLYRYELKVPHLIQMTWKQRMHFKKDKQHILNWLIPMLLL